MKRSSLLVCIALSAVTACSYYDTGLLKFSETEPETGGQGGTGGSGNAGKGGVSAGAGGNGAAAGIGGAAGSAGIAGAGGSTGGIAGTGGVAGAAASAGSAGSASNAGGSGAGASGVAGSAGNAGSGPVACQRATVPTRPSPTDGGASGAAGNKAGSSGAGGTSAGSAGQSGSAGGGGAAGKSGAAGTSGAAGASGSSAGGSSGFSTPDNIILAIRKLDFGETNDPTKSTIGFDLDGSCTCIDTPGEVCKPWKDRTPLCDGPGGRDNSFPRLLQTLVTYGIAQSSQKLSSSLETGNYTILLRIQNWNLQPNDSEVTVSFYTSDGSTKTPDWNGKDTWRILSTSVEDGDIDKPLLRDSNAYVADGNLVASLPTFDANDKKVFIQLNDEFGISLSGTRIVGKLEEFLGNFRILDGTLAGSWRDRDFFGQVATNPDPLKKTDPPKDPPDTVCTDSLVYGQIKGAFCDFADLAGNQADISGVCAALSLATTFNAQEARLGAVVTLPPPRASTCAANTNPSNDGCAKK